MNANLWDEIDQISVLKTVFDKDVDAKRLWKDRFFIQNTLGANEHFLGTGYTKSLIPGAKANDPGIAELFVVENKLMTIRELEEANVIKVFDVIESVSKK